MRWCREYSKTYKRIRPVKSTTARLSLLAYYRIRSAVLCLNVGMRWSVYLRLVQRRRFIGGSAVRAPISMLFLPTRCFDYVSAHGTRTHGGAFAKACSRGHYQAIKNFKKNKKSSCFTFTRCDSQSIRACCRETRGLFSCKK